MVSSVGRTRTRTTWTLPFVLNSPVHSKEPVLAAGLSRVRLETSHVRYLSLKPVEACTADRQTGCTADGQLVRGQYRPNLQSAIDRASAVQIRRAWQDGPGPGPCLQDVNQRRPCFAEHPVETKRAATGRSKVLRSGNRRQPSERASGRSVRSLGRKP